MAPSENEITIEYLVDEFSKRLENGERPSIAEYQQKYPQFSERIFTLFSALISLEEIDSATSGRKLAVDDSIPEILGDYQIIQEVGRGGMGIVFETKHTTMHRRVALKVLPKSYAEKSNYLKRFLTEARSAGQLHHTNIVPVFEIGESDGLHYYSMQFIHGDNLDSIIEDVRRLRDESKNFDLINRSSRQFVKKQSSTQKQPATNSQMIATELVHGLSPSRPVSSEWSEDLTEPVSPNSSSKLVQVESEMMGLQNHDSNVATASRHRGDSNLSVRTQTENSTIARTHSQYHHRVAEVGVQVAYALTYAHEHGVLHRDIKPANLILDTEGNVWITDFGLAKLQMHDMTQTGEIIGTLRYMAPERFAGEADARSDIYSLGLTLYELCTLKCAFENDRGTLFQDVANSSSVIQPRIIDETIPPDLETIILKAIDPLKERRYQTARELADDLDLFLNDRPIKARRVTPMERFWRLCRRNPGTSAMAFGLFALLVVIASGSTLAAIRIQAQSDQLKDQIERAESHLELTEATIDKMLINVGDKLTDVPQMEATRFRLFSDALDLQNQILKLEPEDAGVTLNTVATHRRMAEAYKQIGNRDQAMETLKKTLEMIDSLPDTPDKLTQQAQVHSSMAAEHQHSGDLAAAGLHVSKAIGAIEKQKATDYDAHSTMLLAETFRQMGVLQHRKGQLEQAITSLNTASDLLERIETEQPDQHASFLNGRINVLNSLAILFRETGELEKAEAFFRELFELCKEISEREIRDVEVMDQLGTSATNFGNLLIRQKRFDDAFEAYREAEKIYDRLTQEFPMTVSFQHMAARSKLSIGSAFSSKGDDQAAEDALRDTIEKCELLAKQHGNNPIARDTHAVALVNLGNVLKRQERFNESVELIKKAIELRSRIAADEPRNLNNLKSLALANANLGNTYLGDSQFELARSSLSTAADLCARLIDSNPRNQTYISIASFTYGKTGELMHLIGEYDQVVDYVRRRVKLYEPDHPARTRAVSTLMRAAESVAADEELDDDSKKKIGDEFALHAIQVIKETVENGFAPEPKDFESREFKWLQDYEAFQKLNLRRQD